MSYYASARWDDRRKSAIPRLEQALANCEKEINRAQSDGEQEKVKSLQEKKGHLERAVENTKANLGEGKSAYQKKRRSKKKKK